MIFTKHLQYLILHQSQGYNIRKTKCVQLQYQDFVFEKHSSDLGLYPLKFQSFWHDIASNFYHFEQQISPKIDN